MTVEDRYREIEHARMALEQAQYAYLKATGWRHTSTTPGSYWLWEKTLPDGRTALFSVSGAINAQRSLSDDGL